MESSVFNRDDYLNTLSKWLYIEDYDVIDIIMATALSISLPGDPVWLFVIAPAGSAKTEILRSFNGDRFCIISSLTPQTLISGLKGSSDTDLLPKLDNRVLIIKDFTSILSKKTEDQAAIFADLREAHDGFLVKSYGSGVGTKRFDSRFGLIAGVTDAIDKYRVLHSQLGERFLKCRLKNSAEAAIDRAGDMAGKEIEMRKALSEATTMCFNYYSSLIDQRSIIVIDSETHERIKALANITAKLRSEVARDRLHKVLYHPQAEVGTRLSKQLLKVGQALAVFYEHDAVSEEEYDLLLRIARDSIPSQRIQLVQALEGQEPMSTKQVGDIAKIPTDTAKELLEDLWMLKLVEHTGDKTFIWELTENTTSLLSLSGLGTQNTLCKHENI